MSVHSHSCCYCIPVDGVMMLLCLASPFAFHHQMKPHCLSQQTHPLSWLNAEEVRVAFSSQGSGQIVFVVELTIGSLGHCGSICSVTTDSLTLLAGRERRRHAWLKNKQTSVQGGIKLLSSPTLHLTSSISRKHRHR